MKMIILKQMPTLVIITGIAVSLLGADVVKTFEEIALFFFYLFLLAAAADVMFNVGAQKRTVHQFVVTIIQFICSS